MDNQTPTTSPIPTPGNIPTENPAVETPPQVYTAPQPPLSPKKPFLTGKIILLIVILLILLGAGGTYLALNSKPKPAPIVSKEAPTSTPSPAPTNETVNWKTYTSSNIGFSLRYPKEMDDPGEEYNEYIEGDKTTVVGFSIFDPSRNYPPKLDYLSIGVRGGNLKNESLARFVSERVTQINKKGLIIQEQPKEVILDSLKGYISKAVDEKFSDYYFSSIADKYIEIEILVEDPRNVGYQSIADKILSTFKFLEISPTPTCRPRPACLDATPRCLIAETSDMCPRAVACAQDAKLCPDGKTYVSRQGPKCEFAACPGQ